MDWTGILTVLASIGIVILIMGPLIYFTGLRDALSEGRIHKMIVKEIITGNKVAVQIKQNDHKIRRKNEDLIRAALDGNKGAIKALELRTRD